MRDRKAGEKMAVNAENELPVMQKIPLCTSFVVALKPTPEQPPGNNLNFRKQGDNRTTRQCYNEEKRNQTERTKGWEEKDERGGPEKWQRDREIPVIPATLIWVACLMVGAQVLRMSMGPNGLTIFQAKPWPVFLWNEEHHAEPAHQPWGKQVNIIIDSYN